MPKITIKPSTTKASATQVAKLQEQVKALEIEHSAIASKYLVMLKKNLKLRKEIDQLKMENEVNILVLKKKYEAKVKKIRKQIDEIEKNYLDYLEKYTALLAEHIKLKQSVTH